MTPNPRLRSILAVAQAIDTELADLLPNHIPDLRHRYSLWLIRSVHKPSAPINPGQ